MPIGPLRSGRAPSWEPVRFIVDQRRDGLVRAVALSGALHVALVSSLIFIARSPPPKGPIYPTYTVDLVGGEKLGGAMPTPRPARVAPAVPAAPPEAKPEVVKPKEEPAPRLTARERRKLAAERKAAELAERKAELAEKVLAAKAKKDAKKKEEKVALKKEQPPPAPKEQELPAAVRERLIAAAMERIKNRAESEQDRQKAAAQPPVVVSRPGEGQGAAGPGVGGRGGGLAKGLEFVQYHGVMIQRIKNSWTWVGRRADLEVTVHFGIQENGEILGVKLLRISGDPSYDDSVVRALKKANPLPPPPERHRADFADVELTFRPRDLQN